MSTYNRAMYNQAMNRAEYVAMQQLVLENVHPSQFSALPPSPKEIERKALLLGIECKKYSF